MNQNTEMTIEIIKIILSSVTFFGVIVAYRAWKSKQNLDRRSSALGYSLTRNRQYFDARNEIANRFKRNFTKNISLTSDEVQTLKDNNDRIIGDMRFVLSHWEVMAISIFDKIIDEKTCFEMVGATLVDTISVLRSFIDDARSAHQNRRRYDYLMILYEDWARRLAAAEGNGSVSRYAQYLDLGKDRKQFERQLASDLADF